MQCSPFWRLVLFIFLLGVPLSAFGGVAISEVLWMGSDLSTADEWIELGCEQEQEEREEQEDSNVGAWRAMPLEECDLAGYTLRVVGASGQESVIAQIPLGTALGVGHYFLIANYDAAHSRLERDADLISTSMSLPNTKLLLRLYNGSGTLIDEVDDGVGAPFAGMNTSGTGARASMERIRTSASGRAKENWITSDKSLGWDDGSPMKGTPGFGYTVETLSGSMHSLQPAVFTGALTSTGSSTSLEPIPTVSELASTDTGAVFASRVLLTEVLPNPIGSDEHEWIELANLGSGSVSIAGWKLQVRTTGSAARTFTFPQGTGSFLLPGQHRSLPASLTSLPLRNGGDHVALLSGTLVLDSWDYPELPEGIAFGRGTESGSLAPLCLATEGLPNGSDFFDVMIDVQSGEIRGVGSVTLNVDVRVLSGSLTGGTCRWDFGDGFISNSCNPPSHAMKAVGSYTVILEAKNYCGTTVQRELSVEIAPKSGGQKQILSNSDAPSCTVLTYTGVVLSEVFPDPSGDEAEEEWIELHNTGTDGASLCGWQLDDAEEGSSSYTLDGISIAGGERLIVSRRNSKIALNNDGDEVRLFAPRRIKQGELFGHVLQQIVSFADAPSDESFGRRDDGLWVWSPYRTPGEANAWRIAERPLDQARIIVSATLPNPVGEDGSDEWIEIMNTGSEAAYLQGWKLSTARSTKKIVLEDISLQPLQTTRIPLKKYGVSLTNSDDSIRLLAPNSTVVSVLDWVDAEEAKIYRPPALNPGRVPALVTQVLGGDSFEIFLINPEDKDVPASIKRAWLAAAASSNPVLSVRLLGIKAPFADDPHLALGQFGVQALEVLQRQIEGRTIDLSFDREPWLGFNQLTAYVHVSTGDDTVQAQLLRQGLAITSLEHASRLPLFKVFQEEAQQARLGIWASAEATAVAQAIQEGLTASAIVEQEGIGLKLNPPPGLAASGTAITFTPTVRSSLYVSINSGAFVALSGSLTITDDLQVRAFAEWQDPLSRSAEVIRSPIVSAWYVLEQADYEHGVLLSEVHPSPPAASGGCTLLFSRCSVEWVELYNPTDETVSLAAWQLDDAEGGSEPMLLGPDVVIQPKEYVVLSLSGSSLALNNSGDSVRLLFPNGEVDQEFGYGKVKTNFAMSLVDQEWCLSQVPSPGLPNVCHVFTDDAPDRDHDGLSDDREILVYRTDPDNPDTDNDGWNDGFEATLVASAGESYGPLIADQESRSLLLAHYSFSLEQLNPKARAYVRKGVVLTTKPYPIAREVFARATPAGVWHPLERTQDGNWTIQFPEMFQAGTVPIDLRVREATGRELILPAATRVVLDRTTPSITVASTLQLGQLAGRSLRRKYVPIYSRDRLAEEPESLPGIYAGLLARSIFGAQPSVSSFRFPLFEAILLVVCLSAVGWCLWEWRRHPDTEAARERRKAQTGGKT